MARTAISLDVTLQDQADAEAVVFAAVQRHHFRPELEEMRERNIDGPQARAEVKTKNSKLKGLNAFVGTDGIIRVGSRLVQAEIGYDAKFPAIMPRKDQVLRAYVRYIHHTEAHADPKHTLSQLRLKVWVMHGMQEVRSIITKCLTCQRAFKKPLEQQMGILPHMRVAPNPPFAEVGLDLMGPFLVKYPGSRAVHKIWAVVFACMSTRSVHVETVQRMDAQSLMNAITCFSSRRPGSTHFVSDNGSNLTKANKELKIHLREWNASSTQDLQRKGIQWTFIPPRAPHRGGCWERIIGLFKRHMATMAIGDPLNAKIFETALINIEGILNRRPLTALSPAADDCEPITPAHILYPAMKERQSCVVAPDNIMATTSLRDKFALSQARINGFWKSWTRDYLHLLHNRQKWQSTKEDLKAGELVLIVDEQLARGHWRLARVVQVVKSSPHVRQVKVRTADAKVILRDRTKLVRLELDDEEMQK